MKARRIPRLEGATQKARPREAAPRAPSHKEQDHGAEEIKAKWCRVKLQLPEWFADWVEERCVGPLRPLSEEEMERLYLGSFEWVYRCALAHVGGDRLAAEEGTSQAYMEIWQRLGKYDDLPRLILHLARRAGLRAQRSKEKSGRSDSGFNGPTKPPSFQTPPEIEEAEVWADYAAALPLIRYIITRRLSDLMRTILVAWLNGVPDEVVAADLGKTINNVRVTRTHAIQRVRKLYWALSAPSGAGG